MHPKIEKDKYYREVFLKEGPEGVFNRGFFLDSNSLNFKVEDTLDILCTPLKFIQENLSGAVNPCILLATGSFAPLHHGHISMMEKAKEKIEETGFTVLGGFFAPDHDSYVIPKVTDSYYNINNRIKIIHDKIKNSEWLRIDSWSGLFAPTALNFTDVLDRLYKYIQKHLGVKIPIYMVFGGDNKRFAGTFQKEGNCIIVGRRLYPNPEQTELENSGRILFVDGISGASSTKDRLFHTKITYPKNLILRVNKNNLEELAVSNIIRDYFKHTRIIEETGELDKKLFKENYPVISLDSLVKGDFNLKVSRHYDYFGVNKLYISERPLTESILFQVNKIPKGYYYLFDDDICSGETMSQVKQLLQHFKINIVEEKCLVRPNINTEILDARDFLLDESNGGLVISTLKGNIERLPYIFPFINPTIRASIKTPLEFSQRILALNIRLKKEKAEQYFNKLSKSFQAR